jgi:hypothetical protein
MKTKKDKPMQPEDILKLEIAEELGLDEKVKQKGWKSLTSKESGKIGGIMSARLKNNN